MVTALFVHRFSLSRPGDITELAEGSLSSVMWTGGGIVRVFLPLTKWAKAAACVATPPTALAQSQVTILP